MMQRDQLRLALMSVAIAAAPLMAQQSPPPQEGQYPRNPEFYQPSNFPPEQLENLVTRIALYPDPLLAQIFAAATFPDQIPEAAGWSDQHHYLTGAALAGAINRDQLLFDPSVQALLPFPSVLQMMAGDMNWTMSIGNAFLSQNDMLQDAVQRMRHRAADYGYLRSGGPIVVNNGPYIEIQPADPGYVVVPYYDPAVVFYRPWSPGLSVGISFGYGVRLGGYFQPWGWSGNRFSWDHHQVIINNHEWSRRWDNRTGYRHPYEGVERRPWVAPAPGPRVVPRRDEHMLRERDERERQAAAWGRRPVEDHRREAHRR